MCNVSPSLLTRTLVLSSLLFLSVLTVFPARALEPALLRSILLLRSDSGRCATGFRFSDDLVITASHFVETICPGNQCGSVSVFSATELGAPASREPLVKSTPIVRWNYSEFDAAALVFSPATETVEESRPHKQGLLPPSFLQLAENDPSEQEELFSLSFPGCHHLELSSGTLSQPTLLGWKSSLLGEKGSSGAPVFTGTGHVVGIVHGADSISGGALSTLFKSRFTSAIMRLQEPIRWSSLSNVAALQAATDHAIAFHTRDVLSAQGHDRLWKSLTLQQMVETIAHRAAETMDPTPFSQGVLQTLLGATLLPHPPPPGSDRLTTTVGELALRSQLERWGNTALAEQGTPSATESSTWARVVAEFQLSRFPGSELMQITLAVTYGTAILFAAVLWGLSIGFAVGRLHSRSLWRRVVAGLAIAFCAWPLSVLFFLLYLRTNRNSYPAAHTPAARPPS